MKSKTNYTGMLCSHVLPVLRNFDRRTTPSDKAPIRSFEMMQAWRLYHITIHGLWFLILFVELPNNLFSNYYFFLQKRCAYVVLICGNAIPYTYTLIGWKKGVGVGCSWESIWLVSMVLDQQRLFFDEDRT